MNTVSTETSLDGTRWGLDIIVTEDGGKPVHAAGLVYDIDTGEGFMSLGKQITQFKTTFIRDLDNHFNLLRGYVLGKFGVDLPKSTIDPEHSLGILDCYSPAGERQRSRIALIDTTDILEPETRTGKIVFSLDHDLNDSFLTETESALIKDGQNIAVCGTISVNLALDYISMASSDTDIVNIVGSTAIAELSRAIRKLVINQGEQQNESNYTAAANSPNQEPEADSDDDFSFMDPIDHDDSDDDDRYAEEGEDELISDEDLYEDDYPVITYKN